MVVPTDGARASFSKVKKCPTNISIVCTTLSGYEADSSDSSDPSSPPVHPKYGGDVLVDCDDSDLSRKSESKPGSEIIVNESCVDCGRHIIQTMNHNDMPFLESGSAQCCSAVNKMSNVQQASLVPSVSSYSDVNYNMQSEEISNQLNQNHRPSSEYGRRSRCSDRNAQRQRSSSTERNSANSTDEISDCCPHAKYHGRPLSSSTQTHSRRSRPSALRNSKSVLSSREQNMKLCHRSSSEPRRSNSQNQVDSHNEWNQRSAVPAKFIEDSCRGCCDNFRKHSEPRFKSPIEKPFRHGMDDQQGNIRWRGSNTHCANPVQTDNQDYQWHLIIRRTDENGKVKCLLNRKLPINSSVSWPARVLNYVNRYCPNEPRHVEYKTRAISPCKDVNLRSYRAESGSVRREQQFSHQNSNQAGSFACQSPKKRHLSKSNRTKSCLKINPEENDDKRNLRLKESCIRSKHFPHDRASRKNDDASNSEVMHSYRNEDTGTRHYDDDNISVSTAHMGRASRSEKNNVRKVRDSDSRYNCGNSKTDNKKRNKSSRVSQRLLSVAVDDSVSCSSSWSDALYMDQKSSSSDFADHRVCRLPSKGYAGDACSSDSDAENVSKHDSCVQTSPSRSRRERRRANRKCQAVDETHPNPYAQRERRVTIDPQPSYRGYDQHKNQHNCLHRSSSSCHRRRRNLEKSVSLSPILPSGERLKTLPRVTNATEELLNEIESIIYRENI